MRICAYIDGNGMGLIHAHISIRYYGLFNAKTPNALSHIEELRSITAMIKHSKQVASEKEIIGLTRTNYYSCGAEMWESSSWYLSITSLEM